MTTTQDDTDALLDRATNGDRLAVESLIGRYRARLRKAVSLRLDRRLAARVDPSDVVQDAMLDASQQFDRFLDERPLPVYPWLRQVALARLAKVHRFHLSAQQRTVDREVNLAVEAVDPSGFELAKLLSAKTETASQVAQRRESQQQLETAIQRLPEMDRELLVLRYLEQMPTADAAAALGISMNAYAQRHVRAVNRLRRLLPDGKGNANHG